MFEYREGKMKESYIYKIIRISWSTMLLIVSFLLIPACAKVIYVNQQMSADSSLSNSQIFRMNIDGSHITNISSTSRSDYSPDVSHDGERIVFLSGCNKIYTMNIDGSDVTEIPGVPLDAGCPKWSRGESGWFIMFTSPASQLCSSIFIINPDGSNLKQITSPETYQDDEIIDSIDDKHIVFSRYDRENNNDRDLFVKYIWDTRPEIQLTNTPNQSETLPVVSHDGCYLAFRVFLGSGLDDQVHVARFTSSTSIEILYMIDLDYPADINISGIDFTDDDSKLLISTQASDIPGNLINIKQEIFSINLDGSNQQRLTNNSDSDVWPSSVP